MKTKKWIKNHIDNTYYILFGAYFVICLELTLLILVLNVSPLYFCLGWVYLFIITLGGYFFYVRAYAFEKDALYVKVGCFTKKVNYKDIKECYITQNNRLSFATSKKRIGIKLANKDIYISPKDMDKVLLKLNKATEVKEKKTRSKKKNA